MINVTCLNFNPMTGQTTAENTYYYAFTNSCKNTSFLAILTSDYDAINLQSDTTHFCLSRSDSTFTTQSTAKTGATCTSEYARLDLTKFNEMQTASLLNEVNTITNTLPTPQDITESFGAGFLLVLPLFLTIYGGRQVLKAFFIK